MKNQKQLKFSPLLIALYMLPALGWWASLLWKYNDDLYKKDVKILQLTSKVKSHDELVAIPKYAELTEKRAAKRWMVIGEGSVFFLFLVGGLWYVYRTYRKELALNQRQTNFQLSITHELKTPIASMQLVFDTLKKHPGLSTEQIQQMAQSGKKEAMRLLSLINDILLSGQLEVGWQPNPKSIDLAQLTDETIRAFQLLYPTAQIKANIATDAQILQADEQGIRHILTNLVENALKYSGSDPVVEISSQKQDGKTILAIADHGPGIAPAERQKVFEKFYRSGNDEVRETKGTGLGLFVVQQIVEAHKGKIRILDNLPKGTRFEITL